MVFPPAMSLADAVFSCVMTWMGPTFEDGSWDEELAGVCGVAAAKHSDPHTRSPTRKQGPCLRKGLAPSEASGVHGELIATSYCMFVPVSTSAWCLALVLGHARRHAGGSLPHAGAGFVGPAAPSVCTPRQRCILPAHRASKASRAQPYL